MNSLRLLKLLFIISLSAFLVADVFAKIKPLTIKEQYDKATNVIKVTFYKSHPVKITEFIEYTLWEFDVLEEFKGKIFGITRQEKQNRIIVIGQTKHDWECPVPPAFKKEKKYLLFLHDTHSRYLYTLITDKQGEFEATEKLLNEIRENTLLLPKAESNRAKITLRSEALALTGLTCWNFREGLRFNRGLKQ